MLPSFVFAQDQSKEPSAIDPQIALEYAYRHALEYSAVFWIEAEQDEQVVASLFYIAETLQLLG